MHYSKSDIRSLVPPHIYQRGVNYYRSGRVRLIEVQPNWFKARVSGSRDYTVEVDQEPGGLLFAECSCPYWDDCKHIVAAMLAAKEHYDNEQVQQQESAWRQYIAQLQQSQSPTETRPKWRMVFTLEIEISGFVIHAQKATIKQDGTLGALRNLGYNDPFDSRIERSHNDLMVLSFLSMSQSMHTYFYAYSGGAYVFNYGDKVGAVFELLRECRLCFRNYNYLGQPVNFADEKIGVEFRLSETEENRKLTPYLKFKQGERVLNSECTVLTSNPIWILREGTLYQIEGINDATPLVPFTREQYEVEIPRQDVSEFLSSITAQNELFENLRLPDDARIETIDQITEKRLYLEEAEEGILITPKFAYGETEVDFLDPHQNLWGNPAEQNSFTKIIRDHGRESEALQHLLNTSVKQLSDGSIITRKNKALEWLSKDVSELIEAGFVIFGEAELKQFKINRAPAQVRVAVESGIDWFDLKMEIDFGGILLSLKELRKALKQKSRYVKLTDGSTAVLPEEWLNRFRHVVNLSESDGDRLQLSTFHVTLIDELFAEAQQKDVDRGYEQRLQQLKNFAGIEDVPQPGTLRGTLRPYQLSGLSWMNFLHTYRFGGCLADDMGLGKTIQTLALLLKLKQEGDNTPTLIVAPTSVVFNWINEIERFAPELRVLNLTGSDRPRTRQNYDDVDVVLTSYGTLRRDIVFLKEIRFNYVILDESQNIKNPVSQTAKAVKLLQADHRLALTGTPVENNTLELWSLFSFLNPGLLGNLNYFKKAFAKPIEKGSDTETTELLRKIVFPFVLRRTKEEVEQDLPPKVENILYCEMSAPQQKLYNQWRDYYRAALLKQIAEVGMDKARMNVLEGLTKLRQIACHPLLVEDTFPGKVGKYDTLLEHFDELLAEGHKILVFSQFVRMLTIIRRYLDSARIPYEYLDGQTRDRQTCVEQFQNDPDRKIFLISLRAGGTGLNLTASDYVIHYDPWWNPAVEAQATDRSHRIGQDKHVFVYKMITKDTVEEKILQLQARKQELVSNLISTDSGLFKHLTVEDIEGLFS